MKPALALCLLLAAAVPARGQARNSTKVAATTTLHNDGTRTESVKDLFKHELSETIYDGRGVVIARKKFLLGDSGDPTQGTIYDGADNVIARVQFFFDDLGRVVEERCSNTQKEIFQRVIRQYDVTGKPLQPQVLNFPVKSPTMRPSRVDFTQSPAPRTSRLDGAQANSGQSPQIETVSPGSRTVITANAEPAPPPNLQIPQTEVPKEEGKKGSKLNPLNWFKKGK